MSSQNPNEIWQVEVGGQVYEAPFSELGVWIGDGALHPEDKVRKGNLKWLEARRVPSLVPFFNAKAQGQPLPVVVSTTEGPQAVETNVPVVTDASSVANTAPIHIPDAVQHSMAPTPVASSYPTAAQPFDQTPVAPQPVQQHSFPTDSSPVDHSLAAPPQPTAAFDPTRCIIHSDIPTVFLCDGCGSGFCKACPNSYGGTVKICPMCGAMCRPQTEVAEKRAVTERRTSEVQAGFGSADFFNALSHPFKFKTSLIFGAVMFSIVSMGRSASGMGGMYLMLGAIFCLMSANALTFGVLANTTENFSQGKTDSNFMPTFENFNRWDDVIHPFFLSIGAYLTAFGPFLLVLLIGSYLVVSSVDSHMETYRQDVERIPGTHYYDANRTVDQSQRVKGLVGDLSAKQQQRIDELENASIDDASSVTDSEASEVVEDQSRRESRQQEELWAMAQEGQRKSLESAIGKSPETVEQENTAFVQSLLGLAAPLIVVGAIFFLWGLFYFPVACIVAGYTRSFGATINPMVGLDTIKRLGGTYVSILFMGLVLLIASGIIGWVLGLIFAPFDMPIFGNLPARGISALFTFYFWVVFCCILGFAMYKKADKLQLPS